MPGAALPSPAIFGEHRFGFLFRIGILPAVGPSLNGNQLDVLLPTAYRATIDLDSAKADESCFLLSLLGVADWTLKLSHGLSVSLAAGVPRRVLPAPSNAPKTPLLPVCCRCCRFCFGQKADPNM